jgi:predicted phosphohydrolase
LLERHAESGYHGRAAGAAAAQRIAPHSHRGRRMKRVAWLTDLHLNFAPPAAVDRFLAGLADGGYDALLVSGDISESMDLPTHLRQLASGLTCPVYFVLGNHDYYFSSITAVRTQVRELCSATPRLRWLNDCGVTSLTERVALVGHDGWADARLGDYERSYVMMNDYRLIGELAGLSKQARWPVLQQMGDEAARYLGETLRTACETHAEIVLVTHVPPFREACWYQGQISNDEWLPHFSSHAVGQALRAVMRDYPHRKLTVLCGHTHGRGEVQIRDNLLVLTGGAEYGSPELQRVLEFA